MSYEEEKSDEVPCNNKECRGYDVCFDQNCALEFLNSGAPYLPSCKEYKPESE